MSSETFSWRRPQSLARAQRAQRAFIRLESLQDWTWGKPEDAWHVSRCISVLHFLGEIKERTFVLRAM